MPDQCSFDVKVIHESADVLCRKITADLPEFFGLPDANAHYEKGVLDRTNFAALVGDDIIGLLSLEFPYPNNANIYWMGVMKQFHGRGIGTALIKRAEDYSRQQNATTITVETLAPTECDENYLKTYQFYVGCGFKPLLNLKPTGYTWNMVYMCKPLHSTEEP